MPRKKKPEEPDFDPVYTCPECGNASRFYEEGYGKIKVEMEYHLDNKKKVVAAVGDIDVDWGSFDADTVTCAECGAKVG